VVTKQFCLEPGGLQDVAHYATRTGIQDYNQVHPLATRTHCRWVG